MIFRVKLKKFIIKLDSVQGLTSPLLSIVHSKARGSHNNDHRKISIDIVLILYGEIFGHNKGLNDWKPACMQAMVFLGFGWQIAEREDFALGLNDR